MEHCRQKLKFCGLVLMLTRHQGGCKLGSKAMCISFFEAATQILLSNTRCDDNIANGAVLIDISVSEAEGLSGKVLAVL